MAGEELEIELEGQEPTKKPAEVVEKPELADEDPLEVLKKQFDAVKAEKEDADRRAFEAARVAKEHEARHAVAEIGSNKALLEQAYSAEELKIADAKRKYSAALQNGDFDSAADAQLEMTRSDGVMRQYATAYAELEHRSKQPLQSTPQAQSSDDTFEEALRSMDPRVAQWARDHKSDVLSPKKQRLAFAADSMAQAKGFKPGSDEYLDFLDEQMGYSAHDKPTQPRISKRAPSAPASRSSSSGSSRKVYLTEDDRHLARQLNMSDVAYAQFKVKAQEGQGGSQEPAMMGRLHMRATASGN